MKTKLVYRYRRSDGYEVKEILYIYEKLAELDLDLDNAKPLAIEKIKVDGCVTRSTNILCVFIKNNEAIEEIGKLANELVEKYRKSIGEHNCVNVEEWSNIYWIYKYLLEADPSSFKEDVRKLLELKTCFCCGAVRALDRAFREVERSK